ncbi:MAG TPA: class I SAM-dependent methyltransferase [Polyangia bacterium]|nr:class I SAM-dependent methyltransferase [Polyangia bacterium]
MSDAPRSPLATPAFSAQAGEAWVRLEDRTDAQIDPFGRAAIARLAPVTGERVLDVGCGCGQTLLELAECVGPSGRVVGVDVSAPMLTRARERVAGHAEHGAQIDCVLADAQTHALPPESFDALYSRFGVMFFEDARAAFANLRRALRPGGRLAFVCWQALAKNDWARLPYEAVLRLLPPEATPEMFQPGRPGPFAFGDADRVRAILADAGFVDVEVAPHEGPLHLGGAATLDEALDYCLHIGPAARATLNAPEPLRPTLAAAIRASLASYASPRGVWMPSATFVVTARSPQ